VNRWRRIKKEGRNRRVARLGNCALDSYSRILDSFAVFQIVFNEISAAEISALGTLEQLELLEEFKVSEKDLESLKSDKFGKIERDGKVLYRFRAKDYRIYFSVNDGSVIVHRVLHKGTFSDFLFRSKMPVGEDEELAKSKHFWKLIDEGRNARRL
jgi:hypothetical protein